MIAANEAVARHLIARGRPTVFRHHEDPAQSRIAMLYEQLAELGVATPPLPEGEMGGPAPPLRRRRRGGCASRATSPRPGPRRGRRCGRWCCGRCARRTTRRARWGTPAWRARRTSTSPRRSGAYPDLLVHRGLLSTLGLLEGPPPEAAELAFEADRSSGAEREAAAVERRGDDICAAFWLRDRLSDRGWDAPVEGLVTGLIDAGLFVTFEGGIVTGFLPSRRLEDDHYRADPLGVMLIGDASGRRIRLGDPIEVRVIRIEPLRGRVELEPADTPRPHRGGPRSVVPRSRRGRAGARPR